MSFTRRSLLAALGAQALPAAARPGPTLMLAREAAPGIDPTGFLVSEKYDGVRAWWDGHLLRFRSGLRVAAPAWFTRRLPSVPLDGELWLDRGCFEALSGLVRREQPLDDDWRAVRYMVFDLPGAEGLFVQRTAQLGALVRQAGFTALQVVRQHTLPDAAALQRRLDEVVGRGGEGLVLHRAAGHWRPGRSDDLLKLKPLSDADATVIGHLPGRGRHLGRLGALRVCTDDGVRFLIGTGFSDAQRVRPPAVGRVVTFTYRGTTGGGVPRFASFLRERRV